MNKRTFDLALGVSVGVFIAFSGFKLWSTRYLAYGKPGGLYEVAKVVKVVA